MAIERGLTHGVKYQTRTIAAYPNTGSSQRWIVGTNALREENEVQIIEYDPESSKITTAEVYTHGPEVWQVYPCPAAAQTLATIYNQGGTYGAGIWRIQEGEEQLVKQAELDGHVDVIRCLSWQGGERLASVDSGHLRTWSLSGGGTSAEQLETARAPDLLQFWAVTWDPHDPNRLCTAAGNNIQVWDCRTMEKTGELEGAHIMPVRDIDFAKIQSHLLASGGDDHKVCIWDLRMVGHRKTAPLQQRREHSHWVWQARFNPSHDALLLSSSSDCIINLWYLPGLSGDSPGEGKAAREASPPKSHITSSLASRGHARHEAAQSYDDHDDSVYGVAWSSSDPWVFASVSYDGRLAINHVPSQVKYKILL
eukprot:jgi/Botrbrau1/11982/Bobra.0115s0018.1